jgi:uncharacterized protein YjbK
MSQTIEIEFKNLLTDAEYEQIKKYFQLDSSLFFVQENHYFDTADFSLKENGAALRIRKKGKSFELTLKQPLPSGLLETNQILTNDEAIHALTFNQIPTGQITQLISEMNIDPNSVIFFGTLTTERAEWEYQNGLLVLDKSSYLETVDYELEYEVQEFTAGKIQFAQLLYSLQIPKRKTDNKIKRFYQRKYELNT